MTDNGVSKKLCTAVLGITALTNLAEDAENKLPYAICIAVICIVYKVIQAVHDHKEKKCT